MLSSLLLSIAIAALALALFTVPVKIVQEILNYLRERDSVTEKILDSTVEFRRLARSVTQYIDTQTGNSTETQSPTAMPEDVLEFTLEESEPWAQEDMTRKAKELFQNFRPGEDSDDAAWAKALHELKRDDNAF